MYLVRRSRTCCLRLGIVVRASTMVQAACLAAWVAGVKSTYEKSQITLEHKAEKESDTLESFKRAHTCLSQLLWPSLSRRGNRPSDLDLMNCLHFHTYFSIRYCFLISALFKGLETVSWPAMDERAKLSKLFHGNNQEHCWYRIWIFTSSRKALLPGFIRGLGVFFEPELGLCVDLIVVWLDCSQWFDSSLLLKSTSQVRAGKWINMYRLKHHQYYGSVEPCFSCWLGKEVWWVSAGSSGTSV